MLGLQEQGPGGLLTKRKPLAAGMLGGPSPEALSPFAGGMPAAEAGLNGVAAFKQSLGAQALGAPLEQLGQAGGAQPLPVPQMHSPPHPGLTGQPPPPDGLGLMEQGPQPPQGLGTMEQVRGAMPQMQLGPKARLGASVLQHRKMARSGFGRPRPRRHAAGGQQLY